MQAPTTRPTPDDVELIRLWIPVAASLVGGLIGTLAALAGNRMAHLYQRTRERERELRDAYAVWAAEMTNAFVLFQYMVDTFMIRIGNAVLKEHGAKPEVKIDEETTRKWNERGVDAFTTVRTAACKIRLLDQNVARAKRVMSLTAGLEPREVSLHDSYSALGMTELVMGESRRVRELRRSTLVDVAAVIESVADGR